MILKMRDMASAGNACSGTWLKVVELGGLYHIDPHLHKLLVLFLNHDTSLTPITTSISLYFSILTFQLSKHLQALPSLHLATSHPTQPNPQLEPAAEPPTIQDQKGTTPPLHLIGSPTQVTSRGSFAGTGRNVFVLPRHWKTSHLKGRSSRDAEKVR